MATSTDFFALVKAAVGEKYDVDITNDNLDKISLGLVGFGATKSTFNTANFDCRNSEFMRLMIGGKGVVIASLSLTAKTVFALPNPGLSVIGTIAPAGYRFKQQQGIQLGVGSGDGTNFLVQVALNQLGVVSFRKTQDGAATQWAANTTVSAVFIGEWDGVV